MEFKKNNVSKKPSIIIIATISIFFALTTMFYENNWLLFADMFIFPTTSILISAIFTLSAKPSFEKKISSVIFLISFAVGTGLVATILNVAFCLLAFSRLGGESELVFFSIFITIGSMIVGIISFFVNAIILKLVD